LDLQDDEMEFTNQHFKTLYYTVIDRLNQEQEFELKTFINTVDQDMANEITTILMEDERYSLDDWNRMNIFPKEKINTVAQLVSETILSLRCFLIDQKVKEFQQETLQNKIDSNRNILEEVKVLLSSSTSFNGVYGINFFRLCTKNNGFDVRKIVF